MSLYIFCSCSQPFIYFHSLFKCNALHERSSSPRVRVWWRGGWLGAGWPWRGWRPPPPGTSRPRQTCPGPACCCARTAGAGTACAGEENKAVIVFLRQFPQYSIRTTVGCRMRIIRILRNFAKIRLQPYGIIITGQQTEIKECGVDYMLQLQLVRNCFIGLEFRNDQLL